MNQKFGYLFFTVFACCALMVFSAHAQGHSHGIEEADIEINQLSCHLQLSLNLHQDKTLLLESSEHIRLLGTGITREQAVTKFAKPKKSADAKKDEALSFNFLYYIISKFKYSDIVD